MSDDDLRADQQAWPIGRLRTGYSIRLCTCEDGPYIGTRRWGVIDRCERCGFVTPDQWAYIITKARVEVDALRAERDALAAAVDRVRRRHPRGDFDRCEYGCAITYTEEAVRWDLAPAVERIIAARTAQVRAYILATLDDPALTAAIARTITTTYSKTPTARRVLAAVRAHLTGGAS